MASTPIELRDVGQSSPGQTDYRESLLAQPNKRHAYEETLILEEPQQYAISTSRWRSLHWKLEIISWSIGLCFFITIIVVLIVFNGHGLPDLPLSINPNAIIQLLGTFGQAFLMVPVASALGQMKWLRALQVRPVDEFRAMDEASRGASGSFMLLVHGRGGIIASCGALITILSLAIGFFVQQALRYDTVYPSSDQAFMPVARYMNGTGTALVPGINIITGGVDTEIQSSAYLGLFSGIGTNFTVSSPCNTGNCTWKSYHTLAICNTCADLTSRLKMEKIQVTSNYTPDNFITDFYSLPNGVTLTGLEKNTPRGSLKDYILNITTTSSTVDPPVRGKVGTNIQTIAFADKASALLSVFAIGFSPGKVPAQPDADQVPFQMTGDVFTAPLAFECLLQFCVQELHAEFRNGTLRETVVSTWTNNTQVFPGLILVENAPTIIEPPGSAGKFVAAGTAVGGTSGWLAGLISGNASIKANDARSGLERVSISQGMVQPFVDAMNNSASGFPDMMDNLAKSLSRGLRTLPYQPPPINGLAFSSTARANVHWAWLAFPFLLLVASLALLIVVIMETERKGLVPWTNNILASLFHGIDKRAAGHQVRETGDAMEDEARRLLVEFQPYEDGGRLVVANSNGLGQKPFDSTEERI